MNPWEYEIPQETVEELLQLKLMQESRSPSAVLALLVSMYR